MTSPVARTKSIGAAAFASELEPHRRALRFHCYQLLGSLTDADDLVQETFARALAAGERFEGRSALKTWLFQIATFAAIDEMRRRKRRRLESSAPANGPEGEGTDGIEPERWIDPFPDALLPSKRYEHAEAVTLAFVAALQWLPPRQRAVLVLRDSLDWSAESVARLLGMTVGAVHAALLRARDKLATRAPDPGGTRDQLATAREFAAAFQRGDVTTLAALLQRDVEVYMPPYELWLRGRDKVLDFMPRVLWAGRDLRLRATRANRRAAVTMVDRAAGDAPFAVAVLDRIRGGRIGRVHTFMTPHVVSRFVASSPGRH